MKSRLAVGRCCCDKAVGICPLPTIGNFTDSFDGPNVDSRWQRAGFSALPPQEIVGGRLLSRDSARDVSFDHVLYTRATAEVDVWTPNTNQFTNGGGNINLSFIAASSTTPLARAGLIIRTLPGNVPTEWDYYINPPTLNETPSGISQFSGTRLKLELTLNSVVDPALPSTGGNFTAKFFVDNIEIDSIESTFDIASWFFCDFRVRLDSGLPGIPLSDNRIEWDNFAFTLS